MYNSNESMYMSSEKFMICVDQLDTMLFIWSKE